MTIEGDSGAGFAPVGSATVGPDGAFTAQVVPSTTTTYRAVAGAEASPPVHLLVLDRRVAASAQPRSRGRVVAAHVTPASPGATVVLQLRLRERFGWWPVRRARVGRASTARLRLRLLRRMPARVVLTLADGATVLAKSRTLHPRRQARPERRSRSSLAPIS